MREQYSNRAGPMNSSIKEKKEIKENKKIKGSLSL